jgi:N-glycosylase/DNA lyase
MLNNLARKYGEKVVLEGAEFFAFPEPRRLARASLAGLTDCGLGYRAKYVSETSKRIFAGDFELERLRKLPYEQAKLELCGLPGVGPKVADCVLLFGLGKLEAFPVDVWVKRVLLNHYAGLLPADVVARLSKAEGLSNVAYRLLNEFGRSYFGAYAGYAQEYVYHWERMCRS